MENLKRKPPFLISVTRNRIPLGGHPIGAETAFPNKKSPSYFYKGPLKKGGDLLSHPVAVPSARTGLTSLFGMERGGPRRHGHPKNSVILRCDLQLGPDLPSLGRTISLTQRDGAPPAHLNKGNKKGF